MKVLILGATGSAATMLRRQSSSAPFDAVCWRPGLIDGMASESEPAIYTVMRPLGRLFFSRSRRWYVTGDDIGRAMIAATLDGVRAHTFENAALRDRADHTPR